MAVMEGLTVLDNDAAAEEALRSGQCGQRVFLLAPNAKMARWWLDRYGRELGPVQIITDTRTLIGSFHPLVLAMEGWWIDMHPVQYQRAMAELIGFDVEVVWIDDDRVVDTASYRRLVKEQRTKRLIRHERPFFL